MVTAAIPKPTTTLSQGQLPPSRNCSQRTKGDGQMIDERDGPICEAEYPLIKPGRYTLLCVAAKIYRHPGLPDHPWKAQLEFKDGFGELHIFGFLHLGNGKEMHAGRTSKYWQAWCLANGGPPGKRQVMSARVFKDKWFECDVGTAKEGTPEAYSVVRQIFARGL